MDIKTLQIGMFLTCDGPGSIPVYQDIDTSSTVLLTIAPGQVIGQIVDFKDTDKQWVIFSSQTIKDQNPWYDKALSILPGFDAVGAVLFTDIQANVKDSSVQTQADWMAQNAQQAATLQNSIKQIAHETGADVGAAASGLFGGVFSGSGGWLVGAAVLFVGYKVFIDQPQKYYKPH